MIPETAWRSTPAGSGPGAETCSIPAILDRAAREHGDAPALASLGETITFTELRNQVRTIGHAVAQAVPPSATVATLFPHSPSGIAAILGCLVSGRLCIPLNAGEPPDRLALLLEDAAPALVLAAHNPGTIRFLNPAALAPAALAPAALAPAALAPAPAAWQPPGRDPDSPCVVHFTSGSSGRPKGIVMSQYSVLHRALHCVDDIGLRRGDRLLATTTASVGSGLSFVLAALAAGATLAVVDIATEGANALLRLAARERITVLIANANISRSLTGLPAAPRAFAALRLLRCGAMSLPAADIRRFRARLPMDCAISHTYASTEASVIAAAIVPHGAEDLTPASSEAPNVAAGTIAPGQQYALLDQDDRPVPDGTPGEMVLRGRHIALGEWRLGTLHPGRMTPDPARPHSRIFRTGDIMRLDRAGLLHFVGRADRQVKNNGVRIEPAEIEAVLRSAAGVSDAAVVTDEAGRLHAFVAGPDTVRPTLAEHLRARLPPTLRPARITMLPALPLLPSGETDLQALRTRTAQ